MARKPASVPVTPAESEATTARDLGQPTAAETEAAAPQPGTEAAADTEPATLVPGANEIGFVQGNPTDGGSGTQKSLPSNQEPVTPGLHDGPPAAGQADTLDYSKSKDPGNVERGADNSTSASPPHLDPTESAWRVGRAELPRSRPQGMKGSREPTTIRQPVGPEDHEPDRESLDYKAGEAAGFTAGVKRAQGQG